MGTGVLLRWQARECATRNASRWPRGSYQNTNFPTHTLRAPKKPRYNLGLCLTTRKVFKSRRGTLAQLVEQRTFNPFVVGSTPAGPTKIQKPVSDHRLFSLPPYSLWQALFPMNAPPPPQTIPNVLCAGGINLDRKLKALQALSVDTHSCLVSEAGSTGSYTALLDAQGQLVMGIADMALTEMLSPELLTQAGLSQAAKLWMADMNLPANSLAWLAQQAHARGQRLVMLAVSEPKMDRLPNDLRGVDTLVLNRGELAALDFAKSDISAAFAKLNAAGLQRLVVTLGEQGVAGIETGQNTALQVADMSGAGDAFCAGLCASYMRYPLDHLAQHVQRAMRLGALTVQSPNTVNHAIRPDLI
jgi:sugar/nucleoside kinase (ribokinase family)